MSHSQYLACKTLRPGIDHPPWWQLKRDGHWTIVTTAADGAVTIKTRLPTEIGYKLEWHPVYAIAHRQKPGTQVVGELWVPGKSVSAVKTAINDQNPALRFTAFGVPSLKPSAPVPQVMLALEACGFEASETFIEPIFGFPQDLPPDVEGYVAKHGNYQGWYKWKPLRSIELIITGTTPGKNRNLGLIGSLACSSSCGIEVANVAGMTDELREQLSFSTGLIGRVVEVLYQEVGSKGRLRFPRLKCFRDDKRKSECTLDQDIDLLEYWKH